MYSDASQKRLPGLFNKSYMDRLKICKLELLETRRICSDVALMYKILNGYVYLELNDRACISHSVNTKGNYCKLSKFGARLDMRKYFFAYRCIDVWNCLLAYIVNCKSLNNFMKNLSSIDFSSFLKGERVSKSSYSYLAFLDECLLFLQTICLYCIQIN